MDPICKYNFFTICCLEVVILATGKLKSETAQFKKVFKIF